MRLAAFGVMLLSAATIASGCGDGERSERRLSAAEIVRGLQEGGYVIFLRHGATPVVPDDRVPVRLDDCSTQRLLSDEGRRQARAIGAAFRKLRIGVGAVLASRYCRTLETARLAFGRTRTSEVLTGLPLDERARQRRLAAVRRLLGRPPPRGRNTVLVGHVVTLKPIAGIGLGGGEMAIFDPGGGARFRLVGRFPAAAWPQLAEQLG